MTSVIVHITLCCGTEPIKPHVLSYPHRQCRPSHQHRDDTRRDQYLRLEIAADGIEDAAQLGNLLTIS